MNFPLFEKRWTEHLILSMWIEWVGEKMAQNIKPGSLNDKNLSILASDERWAKAFEDLQDMVLKKINNGLGEQAVKGFIIRMERPQDLSLRSSLKVKGKSQDLSSGSSLKAKGKTRAQSLKSPFKADEILQKDTEQKLDMIKDPDVKAALRRLLIKSVSSFKQD